MRDLLRPPRRAVAVAAVCVSLLLAGFAAIVVKAERESRQGLEERFQLRGALAARFVESFLAATARQERVVARARLTKPRVGRREFEAVVERFGFSAAVLLDARGRVLHVHPYRADLLGAPIAQRYRHLRAAVQGETSVSDVVLSAAERLPVVAVAVPFRSAAGRRVFSGAFPVKQSPIEAFLRNAIPLTLGSARLFDGHGNLITGTAAVREDPYVVAAPVQRTGWRVELAAPRSQLFAPVSGAARWVPWALFAGFAMAAAAILALALRLLEKQVALRDRNREVMRLMGVQQSFVATTSHELRTPLTSVLGFVDFILKGSAGPLGTEHRKLLEIVRRNAGRLLELVADLLMAAQLDAGKLELHPEYTTLEEVAREAVETAHAVAEQKGVELVLETPAPAAITADRKRLVQVVGNLVSNAVKFTPPAGRVEVRSFRENGNGVLEVSDTGIGIPAEEQGRLFERFFRASTAVDQEIPGTGLGLAIARSIVELHGGRLLCTSVEGVGSTFRLELPASE